MDTKNGSDANSMRDACEAHTDGMHAAQKRNAPSPSHKSTVEKIYVFFIKEIAPKNKTKKRAIKNVTTWLGRGRTEKDLIQAVKKLRVGSSFRSSISEKSR